MSSFMLRGCCASAHAEEWDAIIGLVATSIESQNVLSDTWEMSTTMPSRFISRITSRPKRLRPLLRDASVEASAQVLVLKCVSVMYRIPSSQ